MKKLLLGAITIWVFVLVPMICAITLDLENATKERYSTFLTELRDEAKDTKLVYYTIPMLPAPAKDAKPPKAPSYILVELKATKEISITVALARDDLYLWAYLDQYKGKYRAHFFSDAPQDAKDKLFKEAKDPLRMKIHYKCNYAAIQSKAGPRADVGLGIAKLKTFMEFVYGREIKDTAEAKFLLVAIQMVAEAMRSKYIENQVLDNFPEEFSPNKKIICLENEWAKISKAFFNSIDGSISPPLTDLEDAYGPSPVTKVTQLQNDMGLLKFFQGDKKTIVTKMFSYISRFFMAIVNNDADHVDL